MTELIVALLVAMILMAIGLPAFLRAYRTYELNNAATQVADILRLTRYEAIRLNTSVQCVVQANPPTTTMWADSVPIGGNGVVDATEKVVLLGAAGNLIAGGGLPGNATLIASAVSSTPVTSPSPTGSGVWFDARGAVISCAGCAPLSSATVFYLASSLAPDAGYRAVFLMPAGSIQIWTSDITGNWQKLR